jgi:hypothetical protein
VVAVEMLGMMKMTKSLRNLSQLETLSQDGFPKAINKTLCQEYCCLAHVDQRHMVWACNWRSSSSRAAIEDLIVHQHHVVLTLELHSYHWCNRQKHFDMT